jgi:hypothetical protein
MNRSTLLAVAALAAVSACKSSTGSGDAPTSTDPFDSQSTLAQNYTAYSDGAQNWSVSGGRLIASGANNQSVLIRNGVSFTDGWVEATSTQAADGGLVLRFKNATDYYLLAFRDDSASDIRSVRNLALYHHTGSAYHEMWDANVTWARGTSHVVRFESAGQKFNIYFDGALVAAVTPSPGINDPFPTTGAGGVGVRAYGDDTSWTTFFDSFSWHATNP